MFKNTIRTSAFIILTMFATNTVFSASSVRQLNVAGSAKTSSATPAVTPARVSTASIIASKAKSATPMITNTTTSAKKTTAARLSTPVNVAKASDSIRLIGTPLSTGNSARNKDKPSSTTSSATLLFNTANQAQKNKEDIEKMTDNFAATNQVLVEAINQKAGAESTAAEINSVRDDLTSSLDNAITNVRQDMLTSNSLDYELKKSNVLLQMNDNINTKASASEVTGLAQRTVDLESAFSKDGNGDMKVKSDALPAIDMAKVNGLSDFYNAVTDVDTGLAAVNEKATKAKATADAAVKSDELNRKIEEYARTESSIIPTKAYLDDALTGIPTDETVAKIQGDVSKLKGTFTKDENGDFDKIKGDYLPTDLVKNGDLATKIAGYVRENNIATQDDINTKIDKFNLKVEDGQLKYTKDAQNWENLLSTSELSGADGKSAYQSWLDAGYEGSERAFVESLRGADGCETVISAPTAVSEDSRTGIKITATQKCGETETDLWTRTIYNGQDAQSTGSGSTCATGEITNVALVDNTLQLTYCGEERPRTVPLPEDKTCADGDVVRISRVAGRNQLKLQYCDNTTGTIDLPSGEGGDGTCANGEITNVELVDNQLKLTYCGDTTNTIAVPGDGTCANGDVTRIERDGANPNKLNLTYCGQDEPSGYIDLSSTAPCFPAMISYGYTEPSTEISTLPTGVPSDGMGLFKVRGKRRTTVTNSCDNSVTITEDLDTCYQYDYTLYNGQEASILQCTTQRIAETQSTYYLLINGIPAHTGIAEMLADDFVPMRYFSNERLTNDHAPSNMVTSDSLSKVATTGNYGDLTNKPILATVATSGSYSDLSNKPTLSTVATTGNYGDLTNKPDLTVYATQSDLSGYATQTEMSRFISGLQDAGIICSYNPDTGVITAQCEAPKDL